VIFVIAGELGEVNLPALGSYSNSSDPFIKDENCGINLHFMHSIVLEIWIKSKLTAIKTQLHKTVTESTMCFDQHVGDW